MKKKPDFDWSKYEEIPFAVVVFSTEMGWIEFSRPTSPKEGHKSYESADVKRKYLLNYGMIVRNTPDCLLSDECEIDEKLTSELNTLTIK